MLHLSVESDEALREAMRDREITTKAKALIGYAVIMGDGYPISNAGIMEDMNDGEKSIRNAVKSLESAGYLKRTQDLGTGSFTWDWHLSIPKEKRQ